MASLSADIWAHVIEANAPELAREVMRASGMADVSITAGPSAVVVAGRALGSRTEAAWRAALQLSSLWQAEVVPPSVACVVVLGSASWRSSGALMLEAGEMRGRAAWAQQADVRLG